MNTKYKQLSLFPELECSKGNNGTNNKSKQKWRFEKSRNFGLEYCSNAFFQGKYGIVQIRKYTDSLPDKLITLKEVNNIGSPTTGVVGFSFDCDLEDYACRPEKHANKLAKYKCIGELDFSMKITDPLGAVIANAFRSHTSAFYYQEHGCKILPTMKWASTQSYDVCFDGYEKGGAVIVSTIGIQKDERTKMYFKNGFNEMLKRISPDSVVLYGTHSEWICKLMPSQLDVHYYEHERFNRMRKYGK